MLDYIFEIIKTALKMFIMLAFLGFGIVGIIISFVCFVIGDIRHSALIFVVALALISFFFSIIYN